MLSTLLLSIPKTSMLMDHMCSLLKGFILSQPSESEKTKAAHDLEERQPKDLDLCEETKAYITKAEHIGLEHCWDRSYGKVCEEERFYLNDLNN